MRKIFFIGLFFSFITVISVVFLVKKTVHHTKWNAFTRCVTENKKQFTTANELDCYCNKIADTNYGNFKCE